MKAKKCVKRAVFWKPQSDGRVAGAGQQQSTICLLILWKFLSRSSFMCWWVTLPDLLRMLIFPFKIIHLRYLRVPVQTKIGGNNETSQCRRVCSAQARLKATEFDLKTAHGESWESEQTLLSLAVFACEQKTTYLEATLTSLTPSCMKTVCIARQLL